MALFQIIDSLVSTAIIVSVLWLVQCKSLVLSNENDTLVLKQYQDQPFILEGDCWHVKNSTDSFQGPILDRRWDDFPTNFTAHISFNPGSSTTVSVFTNKSLEINITGYVNDDETYDNFQTPLQSNEWVNFTFLIKNETVYVYRNQEHIATTPDMKPEHIIMKSTEDAYRKIQNYDWSSCTSAGKSLWTFDKPDRTCLLFYVSLCENCFLNVSISNKSYIEFTPNANESTAMMKSWQSKMIEIERNETNITFNRIKSDNVNEGLWEVDIRLCPINMAENEDKKKPNASRMTGKSTKFSLNIILGLAGLGLAAII